jgi:hypothetical protein
MPAVVPLTVHGSREPKRSRGIPSHIRQCVMIMVRGLPDDPERKAVDYVRAAHSVGIDPALMRRWLNRGEVRALLYHENKQFIAELSSGNAFALQELRDNARNEMVRLGAIKQIHEMHQAEVAARQPASSEGARFQLNIVTHTSAPSAVTIDSHRSCPRFHTLIRPGRQCRYLSHCLMCLMSRCLSLTQSRSSACVASRGNRLSLIPLRYPGSWVTRLMPGISSI